MATESNHQALTTRPLLTDKEAAAILGLAPETLATWRCTKRVDGPRYVKMGGAVRYPMHEIEAFIARSLVTE